MPPFLPQNDRRRKRTEPHLTEKQRAQRRQNLRWMALATGAALFAMASAQSRPVRAAEPSVSFGAPTVLSARGQRLKVAVPVQREGSARLSAASFLIETVEAPQGLTPPNAEGFTVLRPARGAYVVFQSTEIVDAPALSLRFTVAGDPRSPYQMDLRIPDSALVQVATSGRPGR